MADSDTKVSLFTSRLPLEIRNEIYKHLLLAKEARSYAECPTRNPICAKLWPRSSFCFQPAILRTNQQIYKEAIKFLYDRNLFVRISTSMFNDSEHWNIGGMPTLSESSKLRYLDHCAMSVTFDDNPGAAISDDERYHCVIAYEDLGPWCEALLYHSATCGQFETNLSDTTLEVAIHHQSNENLSIKPRSTSVQCRLLEPFANLHSVREFKITGHVNTEYANSIILRASRLAPSVEETVDRVLFMSREALNLSDRGHYAQARDKYKSAMVQAFTKVRHLTAEHVLRTGLLAGRTQSFAFTYLEFMLKCKIAMCHVELGEWKKAHFWVCDALGAKFFPTYCAEAFYRTAWLFDAESKEIVQILEDVIKLRSENRDDLYKYQFVSKVDKEMRSEEGIKSLSDLKAAMEALTERDWDGKREREVAAGKGRARLIHE